LKDRSIQALGDVADTRFRDIEDEEMAKQDMDEFNDIMDIDS